MKHSEKLDLILTKISENKDFIGSKQLFELINKEEVSHELVTPIVNKLFADNYVEKKILDVPNYSKLTPPYFCRITFSGLLFLERGGYKQEDRTIKRTRNWTNAKTFANRLNSIIILIVACLGVYFSWYSNKKDNTIDKQEKIIEQLRIELKTKKTNSKLNSMIN